MGLGGPLPPKRILTSKRNNMGTSFHIAIRITHRRGPLHHTNHATRYPLPLPAIRTRCVSATQRTENCIALLPLRSRVISSIPTLTVTSQPSQRSLADRPPHHSYGHTTSIRTHNKPIPPTATENRQTTLTTQPTIPTQGKTATHTKYIWSTSAPEHQKHFRHGPLHPKNTVAPPRRSHRVPSPAPATVPTPGHT